MPDQVSDKVKRERVNKMLVMAGESALNFRQRFLDQTMPVLWEQKSKGVWSGYTANYIKVYARSGQNLTNQLVPVKLDSIYRDGVWGKFS